MAGAYEDLDITLDTDTLFQRAVDYLQNLRPDWTPSESNFDVIMLSAIAQMAYEQALVASLKPSGIFRYFAEDLQGLPARVAIEASGTTTWTASDTDGHTIPAGTQIVLDNQFAFEVVDDVVIPLGSTSTAPGEVEISALDAGADSNGLGGTAELVDALDWVDTITVVGVTGGGEDAETDDEYESRLADILRLQAPRPITPADFAAMTRQQPGVDRALAIDGYNPADSSYGNERMIAVAAIDADGLAVPSTVKNEIDALLQSYREVNFVVNVIDPSYTTVNVTFTAHALPNWDAAAVKTAAQDAVADYLSPANWGRPQIGEDTDWITQPVVRLNEVIAALSNVAGLDYVDSVTLNGSAANLNLTGAAPLPTPGTISGTVL